VNRAKSAVEGLEVFGKIDRVSQRFLKRPLFYLGHILNDTRVGASVASRIPIVLNQPAAPASACFRGVGRTLLIEIDRKRGVTAGGADCGVSAGTNGAAAPRATGPEFPPERGPECA